MLREFAMRANPVIFDPALSPLIFGYYLNCCAMFMVVLLITPSTSWG